MSKIRKSLVLFKKLSAKNMYQDRTKLIENLNTIMDTDSKYVCVHTKAGCGKSTMARMIASYYSKEVNSREIFDKMDICTSPSYLENLNKHNVIMLDLKDPKGKTGFDEYLCGLEEELIKNLIKRYPQVNIKMNNSIRHIFKKIYLRTSEKFILLIDNWDDGWEKGHFERREMKEFLRFLLEMIIDAEYMEMVYVTGSAPVTEFAELNPFLEIFEEFELSDTKIIDLQNSMAESSKKKNKHTDRKIAV